MNLDGKKIVITGCGSGIGAAILHRLAAYDAQIIGVDLDAARVDSQIKRLTDSRATISSYGGDIGQPAQVDALFDHAIKTLGGIDLFIANAGFAYYEKIETPDWDHIDKIYRVNVYSPIYTAEKMLALNKDKPFKVVMTASAMAKVGLPGYALYSSTKAALDRFAEAYRLELATPESLMLVYPIATRTSFFQSAASEAPKAFPMQIPEQVAQAVIRSIERNHRSVHPSPLFRLLLVLDRVMPARRLTQWVEGRKFQDWLSRR